MPLSDGLPPLSAVNTVRIQIWGNPSVSDVWGTAIWGPPSKWFGEQWIDATPQSLNAQITWGTDDNYGALSVPAAGSWSVRTYDPERKLDPANTTSPLSTFLHPGGLTRIMYVDTGISEVVRTGFIDEITFDMMSKTGDIRASDGITLLAKAKVPEGLAHDATVPLTLRALARWMINKAQVGYITVEANPVGTVDPAVGYPIDTTASVWQQITTAAFDALYAVWLDREGILRFRYFGDPIPYTVTIGGTYNDSIPIDTVTTRLTLENVFNHAEAIADDIEGVELESAIDNASVAIYGDLMIRRDRPNPQADMWVTQLVQDRGKSSVEYETGIIRPQTWAQLLSILNLGMLDTIRLSVSSAHGPSILQAVQVLGGRIEANVDTGWSAGLVTYKPATPLFGGEIYQMTQFRIATNKSREIITNVAGANSGISNSAQQQVHLSPMVAPTDEKHSILLDFPLIDWAPYTKFIDAKLLVYRPIHDDLDTQIGEKGHVRFKLITQSWDETAIWPGPSVDASVGPSWPFDTDLSKWYEYDVSALVKKWAPTRIPGGGGLPQYGIKIEPLYTSWKVGPMHWMISTRLSTMPAYLKVKGS